MLIDKWVKSKYAYIFLLSTWLMIDGWHIYQFQHNIKSSQPPSVTKELCESILSNLFYINLLFTQAAIVLSAVIFINKKNGFYFVLTYAVYTTLTTLNSFQLSSLLIHYSKQQGVWAGGSPVGEFLHILLLAIIGLVVVTPYLLFKLLLWLKPIVFKQK